MQGSRYRVSVVTYGREGDLKEKLTVIAGSYLAFDLTKQSGVRKGEDVIPISEGHQSPWVTGQTCRTRL